MRSVYANQSPTITVRSLIASVIASIVALSGFAMGGMAAADVGRVASAHALRQVSAPSFAGGSTPAGKRAAHSSKRSKCTAKSMGESGFKRAASRRSCASKRVRLAKHDSTSKPSARSHAGQHDSVSLQSGVPELVSPGALPSTQPTGAAAGTGPSQGAGEGLATGAGSGGSSQPGSSGESTGGSGSSPGESGSSGGSGSSSNGPGSSSGGSGSSLGGSSGSSSGGSGSTSEGSGASSEGSGASSEGLVSPPEGSSPSAGGQSGQSDSTSGFRFFAPSSVWNEQLAANAPLDPASETLVSAFDAEVAAEELARSGPWINTTAYSVPIYTVSAGQPTVPVVLVKATEAALSSAWNAVPLPATATAAAGSDGDLVVWQPSTDRMWEFWRLVHEGGEWHASWGGAIQSVSSDSGVFGPEAWAGAKPWWGVTATSLPLAGGLITLEDLERGRIEHALAMSIPNVRAGVYASPAQRTDGQSLDPLSLPEGAHLRLDPNLDLAALHLPPLTLMVAEAAQRYGIIIRDKSQTIGFYAQDPTPTGTEPYRGSGGYFEGKYPNQLLASFPWSYLEVLDMDLHSKS